MPQHRAPLPFRLTRRCQQTGQWPACAPHVARPFAVPTFGKCHTNYRTSLADGKFAHTRRRCVRKALRASQSPPKACLTSSPGCSRLARRTTVTIMRQVSRPHQSNVKGGPRTAPDLSCAANRQLNQCASEQCPQAGRLQGRKASVGGVKSEKLRKRKPSRA
jgi:hypothetical protein